VNGDQTYRHLEIGVSGLVSGGEHWRQLRVKLFARRTVLGLEFRDMKGWPAIFDIWPGKARDPHGPFWRLETEETATALEHLGTMHDRAFVSALIEVLPELAVRGAEAAALPEPECEGWASRARALAAAVASARGAA
jgi:hypothetical protein